MWNKLKEQFNLLKLEKKKLCLITNSDKFDSKDEFLNAIASALQGGVDVIRLDEKNIPDIVIVDIGHKVRILCDEFRATFIVNNRVDIARIVEADGVHLGQTDISINDARIILGENAIVGKTVTSHEEIITAVNEGADYLSFGPIMQKNNIFTVDEEYLTWIVKNIDVPTFFTGEIGINNMPDLTKLGIKRIALKDSLMYARIPEQTARNILYYL